MSTDYRPAGELKAEILFDGRLAAYGVTERSVGGDRSGTDRILTDGDSCVHVLLEHRTWGAYVTELTSYGLNDESRIVSAIERACGVELICEHDEARFWGFDSEEAYVASFNADRDDEAKRRARLLAQLRGENSDGSGSSIEAEYMEIGRAIVEARPHMLEPTHEAALLNEIEGIFESWQQFLQLERVDLRTYTRKIALDPVAAAQAKLRIDREIYEPKMKAFKEALAEMGVTLAEPRQQCDDGLPF